jgi:hypothetical protein
MSMGVYRATIPVTVLVEITDENEAADERPAIRGDSRIVAVRRAIWCLLDNGTEDGRLARKATRQRLGVRRVLINGRWEDMECVEVAPLAPPATDSAGATEPPDDGGGDGGESCP